MADGKKIALFGCLGCLVITVIVAGLIAGGIGWISYRGYQFGKEVSAAYTETAQKYQDLNQRFAFTPPADGILQERQIQLFLEARGTIARYFNSVSEQVKDKGKDLDQAFKQNGVSAKIHGFSKVGEIIKFFAMLGSDIGRTHAQILENITMSPKEYEWITQVYLGTLSKASAEQFPEGNTTWKEYLKILGETKATYKNVNFQIGNRPVRGEDLNPQELAKILDAIPFIADNQTTIQPSLEKFTINKDTVIIDFLAVNFEAILSQLTKGANQSFVPPVPTTVPPGTPVESQPVK